MRPQSPVPALTALLFALAGGCGEPRPAAPNVILISLDTCRADSLSCYGAERANTPNLDRLAAESVLFEDCRAQSSGTAPSHMSLFTGQYVHRHGLRNNDIAITPRYTLASLLRDAGWTTAAFTGHGSLRAKLGHDFGFERFESWVGEPAWPHTRGMREVLPRAERWLAEEPHEPFFLLVHGYDPHCPYWPPAAERERYAGWYGGALEPERLCGVADFGPLLEAGSLGGDERRYLRDLYEAEVSAADATLGGFLDGLRERGLLDRSIVVFTSDHGELLGDHGWVGHTLMWEDELDVPLLIRFPGGAWAGRNGDPVEHVDVLPTLLAALGLAAPDEGPQGVDLMPRLRGEAPGPGPERMRLAFFANHESARFGPRHKISFTRTRANAILNPRLFDLVDDPGETRNLVDAGGDAPHFEELYRRYHDWRAGTSDEDARTRGRIHGSVRKQDAELLNALGYVDDDE